MVKFLILFALVAIASADYGTHQATKVDKVKEVYGSPVRDTYARQYAPRYDYARYTSRYSPYEYISGGVYSHPQTYDYYGTGNQGYSPYQYGAGERTYGSAERTYGSAGRTYGAYDSSSHSAHEPYNNHGYTYY